MANQILGLCNHVYQGPHSISGFCPSCDEKLNLLVESAKLEGSEKQVEWARTIRVEKIRKFVGVCKNVIEYKNLGLNAIDFIVNNEKINAPLKRFLNEKSAKVIIETQNVEIERM